LRIIDGRIRTLFGVLHIVVGLDRNSIYVSKMDDARVKSIFEKETFKMVQRAMVLLKGVHIGTLYKMQGSTISNGCNASIVPHTEAEEEKTPTIFGERLFCGIKHWGISERRDFDYYTVKVWFNVYINPL
jgi:hypothetical protein